LTCDYGAYIEIIGGGASDKPLRGRVTGIAHLDSLRCVPTGNLEFPVVYWSRRSGQLHRLHHTRVERLVDMPDGDESFFGAGLCSLSRAIALVAQQIPLQRYVRGQLSDTPMPGHLFLEGVTVEQYVTMMRDYKMRREMGYQGPAAITGSSSTPIKGTYVPFSMAPEGFNYTEYVDIAVNAFAAAFGIDRQDLWPLAGKMAGTATQSEVMAQKAMGMAFGDLLSKVKRMVNTRILPPSLEFDFEYRDEEKDKQVADRTAVLISNANSLKALGASTDLALRYLAMQDETLRDVLLDERGELVSLPDDDVLDNEQPPPDDVIETDDGNMTQPDDPVADETETKDITTTEREFSTRFQSLIEAAITGDLTKRTARAQIRSLIYTYGSRGYGDGMEMAGVDRNQMTGEDEARIQILALEQYRYVNAFLETLFAPDATLDTEAKALQWFNKSIMPFVWSGQLHANPEKLYEWRYGPTDHCEDCLALNGQIHTMQEYVASGWLPQSDQLACHGDRCQCGLIPAPPGAQKRGVFPSRLLH
jgi:hypothetical protein